MRKLFTFVAVIAAGALVNAGCEHHTSTSPDGNKSISLTKPSNATITQGETANMDIKISRKGFNEPVTVRFEGLPEGVTVEEKDNQIAKDSNSTRFTLKAAANAAPVTDKAVTVITSASGIPEVRDSFNVTVRAK